MRAETPWWDECPCNKRKRELPFSAMRDTAGRQPNASQETPHQDSNSSGTLILDVPVSRTMRNVCYLSHPVPSLLFKQPSWLPPLPKCQLCLSHLGQLIFLSSWYTIFTFMSGYMLFPQLWISQLWHSWHYGLDNFLYEGGVSFAL